MKLVYDQHKTKLRYEEVKEAKRSKKTGLWNDWTNDGVDYEFRAIAEQANVRMAKRRKTKWASDETARALKSRSQMPKGEVRKVRETD